MSKRILAVHEKNLDSFLASVGLLEALEKGELKCGICSSVITRDNFRCVYPDAKEIKVCCDRLECYEAALRGVGKEK